MQLVGTVRLWNSQFMLNFHTVEKTCLVDNCASEQRRQRLNSQNNLETLVISRISLQEWMRQDLIRSQSLTWIHAQQALDQV